MKIQRRLFALLSSALLFGSAADSRADADMDRTLITRGEYVAQLGDCVACHTADNGATMAGGRKLVTPMGVIFSTNITPDSETGIGKYSFAQFDRVMRHGIAADGHNLYPAMPYPSYAKTSEADMRALYAFLLHGLPAVKSPNKPADMSFPFNLRFGLSIWNFAFVDSAPFKPDAGRDAIWNRGAYLVESLGHCGACHTPRGFAFQEKAMSAAGSSGNKFLAGETVEGWRAVSLRDLWTVEETAKLLKTGQNAFATVSGGMTEVIHNSTQHFTGADLMAIATYLKSLPAGKGDLAPPTVPATVPARIATSQVPATMYSTRGGLGYAQFCTDCHRPDGAGVDQVFPPLAQNPTVADKDPSTLIHIMLTGWKTAETKTHPRVYTMPAFTRLSDLELAEIVSFVRRSWGNITEPVTANSVKAMRAQLDPKVANSSAFVTPRLSDMLAVPNAAQVVRGMRLHVETKALLPNNVGNQLNCTSCHLNAGTVADGSPFVGVSAFFPSYAPRAGRVITIEERINGCFLRSMNGKPLPKDSSDMKAMVAYFDWMKRETRPEDKVEGRGVGKIDHSLKPDVGNGPKVYAAQCAVCHGKEGEGLRRADGRYVYPPLWGTDSFNIGAGMARTYTAAAFVKRNMPIGFHDKFPLGQGGLSDQDAVDVAEFFSHQPRPDFAGRVNDFPKDKKPSDARY